MLAALLLWAAGARGQQAAAGGPFLVVLGIAQDGGVPHAGSRDAAWSDPSLRRSVTCVAVVDTAARKRWMVDATPDFPAQLHALDAIAPPAGSPRLDGILLTHAHIGHYAGLMHLGLEVMGTRDVPAYAMPRMAAFIRDNGPWSQLVAYHNIALQPLEAGRRVQLSPSIAVEPFLVPHRQEYSEVIGLRIAGPRASVLLIPDIDSWERLDSTGTSIEELIRSVDVAYIDGTFWSDDELPAAIRASVPHPRIAASIERFAALPAAQRAKIRFWHLNHTNPALYAGPQRDEILRRGFRIAEEGERVPL
jgi:pyrroloquinoline quinone biosynthesis protein B